MLNHVCLSALLLAGLLQQPPTEAGWTSLFDGTDFTGWKISKPGSFKIEDGAIVADGAASHAYDDGSFRNHNFKDFEVEVDVMTRTPSTGRNLQTGTADGRAPDGRLRVTAARSRCRRTTRTAPCTSRTSGSSRSTDQKEDMWRR